MQNQDKRLKTLNFELWLLVFSFQLLIIVGIYGCSVVEFVTPEGPPSGEQIAASYRQTKLRTSSSADVLATIYLPEYELLSQSESVIASAGQKKKGYKSWLNMVAFDEDELTATRKYLFVVDEKPKTLLIGPRAYFSLDCEMVLESEVLDEPYANENARRIAVLRQVLENVRMDVGEVSSDNKTIVVCGAMTNQALETVLIKLDSSPALAVRISEPAGLGFEHTSFDKGKIRMVVTDTDNIVTLKVRLGSHVKKWKVSFEEDIDVSKNKGAEER